MRKRLSLLLLCALFACYLPAGAQASTLRVAGITSSFRWYTGITKEMIPMACHVQVTGGQLEQQEINAYIQRAKQKFGKEPFGIDIHVDGDYVDLSYDFGNQPFQRIRRITGYLVGTLDRFNNAKRAEEHDRVKHGLA